MAHPPQIQRHLQPLVSGALADTAAVLINGPRQCGKTTLVTCCSASHAYVTLDDPIQLAAVRADPVGFIRRQESVIVDEIQRAPELLMAIKLSVDQDRRPGRFLLTGSANLMALPTVVESLAGRMEIHTLLPLSNAELAGRSPDFLERARAQQWPTLVTGNPSVAGAADALTTQVLSGALRQDGRKMHRYSGEYFSGAPLARLEPQRIESSCQDTKDSLSRCRLTSGADPLTTDLVFTERSRFGATLETWVFGELLKILSLTPDPWFVALYRDKDQVEVDLVLESPLREIIGIEVKAAASVSSADFKGLRRLHAASGDAFVTGIVLYDGTQALSFGESFWAVPLAVL